MAHDWNDDEYWSQKITPVNKWIEEHSNNADLQDEVELIEMQVNRGTRRADIREKSWNAMLLEFRAIENAPIGGAGRGSTLSPEILNVLNEISKSLVEGYAKTFGGFIQLVEFRRTKGEDAHITYHDNPQAYGEYKATQKIAMLKRMLKNEEWDGTLEGLQMGNLLNS